MNTSQKQSLVILLVVIAGFVHGRPQENTGVPDAVTSTSATTTTSTSTTATSIVINNSSNADLTTEIPKTVLENNTTVVASTAVPSVSTDAASSVPPSPPLPIQVDPTTTGTVSATEIKERTLESRAISGTTSGNGNKSLDHEFDGPIRRCSYNGNTDVNKCLRQILEDLKPRLGAGIPEINLPPMDPLYLKSVSFHHGSGPIKILATFKDVNATGLSLFDKSDFTFDVKKRTLDFDLSIPHMRIVGNYELSGNLFFFPIGGAGGFWLNLGGIKAKGQGKLSVSAKNNLKSIQIKKIDIDLTIEMIKVHLSNLFQGDQLLGTVINTFLNENANEIFEEVRPQIGIQVAEMVQLLSNRALASLSSDHFADIRPDTEV